MSLLDVPAPMRGSVLEVLVNVGEDVTEGAELLVVESMKMEIPVESPGAGQVAEILVNPGDRVEEGDLLLRLNRGA